MDFNIVGTIAFHGISNQVPHASIVALDTNKGKELRSPTRLIPFGLPTCNKAERPRVCPKCKSPNWDRPRKRPNMLPLFVEEEQS